MSALVFVLLCGAIIILDSIIVRLYANLSAEQPLLINLLLFDGLVIFLIMANYVLLRWSRHSYYLTEKILHRFAKVLHYAIMVVQGILCGLILWIALEIAIFASYHILVLYFVLYLSYGFAIGCLLFLGYQFFSWFRKSTNFLILLYAFGFVLIVLNSLASVMYLTSEFSYYDPIVETRKIKVGISDSPRPPPQSSLAAILYDYTSVLSFLCIWIPTVMQLRAYSVRFGKIRYWIMVAIPLGYYFFPIMDDEFDFLQALRIEYGREFNIPYILLFSPYKQVGGLLFGIVFWVMAVKIKRRNLQIMLKTAGAGMMLLFGSTVLHGLTYIVSPPFGIITISFTGIASYMILVGIFYSSKELARDALVRREMYRIVGTNTSILRSMSLAEMERKLEKDIRPILGKIRATEQEFPSSSVTQEDVQQEDVEEMVREVLDEVNSLRKKKM